AVRSAYGAPCTSSPASGPPAPRAIVPSPSSTRSTAGRNPNRTPSRTDAAEFGGQTAAPRPSAALTGAGRVSTAGGTAADRTDRPMAASTASAATPAPTRGGQRPRL